MNYRSKFYRKNRKQFQTTTRIFFFFFIEIITIIYSNATIKLQFVLIGPDFPRFFSNKIEINFHGAQNPHTANTNAFDSTSQSSVFNLASILHQNRLNLARKLTDSMIRRHMVDSN